MIFFVIGFICKECKKFSGNYLSPVTMPLSHRFLAASLHEMALDASSGCGCCGVVGLSSLMSI